VTKILSLAALLACTALATPALAQEDMAPAAGDSSDNVSYFDSTNQSYLSLSLGEWGIFDSDDDSAMDARIEYRSGDALFWKIKPWMGAEATTDGSLWAGGGLLADFKVAPNIYVIPSVGAGLYAQGGSDQDLGSALEFRTQLEGGYEFTNGHRVGVAFSHISNAGIDDTNPGTETLNVYYSIPVGNLF